MIVFWIMSAFKELWVSSKSLLQWHPSLDLITQSLPNESPAGHACTFPIVFCDVVGKEGETPWLVWRSERNPCAHSKCNTGEAKNLYLCYVTVIISLINNWLAVIMLTINYQNGCLDFAEPVISTSWKTLTTGTLVIAALCL